MQIRGTACRVTTREQDERGEKTNRPKLLIVGGGEYALPHRGTRLQARHVRGPALKSEQRRAARDGAGAHYDEIPPGLAQVSRLGGEGGDEIAPQLTVLDQCRGSDLNDHGLTCSHHFAFQGRTEDVAAMRSRTSSSRTAARPASMPTTYDCGYRKRL